MTKLVLLLLCAIVGAGCVTQGDDARARAPDVAAVSTAGDTLHPIDSPVTTNRCPYNPYYCTPGEGGDRLCQADCGADGAGAFCERTECPILGDPDYGLIPRCGCYAGHCHDTYGVCHTGYGPE